MRLTLSGKLYSLCIMKTHKLDTSHPSVLYIHMHIYIYTHRFICHVQILQMFSLSYGQIFIKTNLKLGNICPKNSIFFAQFLLAFQDVCKGEKYWKLVPLLGEMPCPSVANCEFSLLSLEPH